MPPLTFLAWRVTGARSSTFLTIRELGFLAVVLRITILLLRTWRVPSRCNDAEQAADQKSEAG
jgi:Tfp pilus assembly protein PilN